MSNDNTAIVRQQPQPAQVQIAQLKPQDRAVLDALKEAAPELHQRALRIALSRPAKSLISAPRAIAAAQYEMETGQREGMDFYVDEKMGILPGYKGVQNAKATEIQFYVQYRSLTDDELKTHNVQPGDTAAICEVYSPQMRDIATACGMAYRPILGVGVIHADEKVKTEDWVGEWPNAKKEKLSVPLPIDPPVGKTWRWKAEKRAYVDGLNHLPNTPTLPRDVLIDAGLLPEEMPPANASLSRDQAEAWVAEARRVKADAEADAAMTPEQKAARSRQYLEEVERHRREIETFGDVIEGEVVDEIPTGDEEPAQVPTPAHERIKGRLIRDVDLMRKMDPRPDADKRIKQAFTSLRKLLPNDSDRHMLREFLFGTADHEVVDYAVAEMLHNWIKLAPVKEDGVVIDWVPSQQSIAESKIVLAAIKPSLLDTAEQIAQS